MDIKTKINYTLVVLDDIGMCDKLHSNDADTDVVLKNQYLILQALNEVISRLDRIESNTREKNHGLRPLE